MCAVGRGFLQLDAQPIDLLRDYAHVRWLDYCAVAYFVTRHAAELATAAAKRAFTESALFTAWQ